MILCGEMGTGKTTMAVVACELARAQKAEALGRLAGGIAHDFNNLLMAIIGNADLGLRDAGPDTPMRRRLLRIEDAAQRASELTTQMLAYSGRGRLDVRAVDLAREVRAILALLQSSVSRNVVRKL